MLEPTEATLLCLDRLHDVYAARYAGLVGLARLLLDRREEAEEVVQEAFVRTMRARRHIDDLYPYIRQAVINLARSRLRRRVRERRLAQRNGRMTVHHDRDPGVHFELIDALRRLPKRQREVVVLRYYEGCSTAETAVELGISTGSVKQHLHRALQSLSQELKGAP